ncbi:MAG: hypothetical protein LC114_12980, partial [Bryobacterales bacterium]|nr:hypothetical protein [Bryobacterales bacterium]
AEAWDRLEIYLPDRLSRKKTSTIIVGSDERWHGMLHTSVLLMKEGQIDDKALSTFWDSACSCLHEATCEGVSETKALRDLRRVIENKVPFIPARGRALERKISRVIAKWRAGGRRLVALTDGRIANGRCRASEIPGRFREKLVARAMHSAGGLAQAWREAASEGWMPDSVCATYDVLSARKSHVPHSIRRSLGPEVQRLRPHVIGPHHAKLQGPYIERDYGNMASGLEFQSDDCTLPVYFWEPDACGRPRLNEKGQPILTRGQFLPWIDTRTTYIVTFQLIPEKTYDSIEIVRGIARLHDEYGLPETLYFERGIWESKLIDGSRHTRTPWKDFTHGLSALGVNVRHAHTPRAKIVECSRGAQDK